MTDAVKHPAAGESGSANLRGPIAPTTSTATVEIAGLETAPGLPPLADRPLSAAAVDLLGNSWALATAPLSRTS